jgi:hypothetical protein
MIFKYQPEQGKYSDQIGRFWYFCGALPATQPARYRLVAILASGSMSSVVYFAHQAKNNLHMIRKMRGQYGSM